MPHFFCVLICQANASDLKVESHALFTQAEIMSPCAEAEGLRQRLISQLSPTAASLATDWVIGDCVAAYWRPHFEPQMYPYLPVHVTRPKETRKLFTVHLPERCYFAVSFT